LVAGPVEPTNYFCKSFDFVATMDVFDNDPPVVGNEETLASFDETTDPCHTVRETCERYYQNQTHVTIRDDGIVELADRMIQEQQQQGSTAASLEWDDEHWHYRNRDDPERTALYILALDAINFCFWPSEHPYEYVDLATSLTSMVVAAQEPPPSPENSTTASAAAFDLSAQSLQSMTPTRMRELFATHHDRGWYPPNLDERCRLWNEVGQVLIEHYDGSCLKFIAAAENSAVALVRLLVRHLAGFRDHIFFGKDEIDTDGAVAAPAATTTTTSTTANSIHFYKRAQICVGDWNAALELHLPDLDQLTTFADYRVPQLLRHLHVLTYDDALATLVDAQTELPARSAMECAIRSATVVAVERLVVALRRRQEEQQQQYQQQQQQESSASSSPSSWNATTTDWYLWQVGEKLHQQGVLSPHHRVRTICY
jgi:hypothetical protein